MSAQGTTTVNFSTGATDAIVAVATGGTWTLAEAWIWPIPTSNNTSDNHVAENLICYAKDAVANTSFNIFVKCTQGIASGVYSVAWVVN